MMTEPAHHQAYYEAAYERLMAAGADFHALDITGLNWTEIDTQEDFGAANKMFQSPAKPATQRHRHLLNAGAISGFRRS